MYPPPYDLSSRNQILMNDWFYAWDKHMIRLYHHECSDISGWKNVVEQINKFLSLFFFFTDMLKLSSIIVQHNSRVKPQASNQMSRQLCASSLTNKDFPEENACHRGTCASMGLIKVLKSAQNWFESFMTPLPSLFPASSHCPSAAFIC